MNRYLRKNSVKRQLSKRTNLIATLFFVVVLSGILLLFTNKKQNEQVFKSYCGTFGLNGKSLVLMKDNTFRFSYYGCSQANGYVSGSWNADGTILTFKPEQPDDNLDDQYQLENSELIPFNKASEDKFVVCEEYESPWERADIDIQGDI